jgi:CRP-like cAMP-binding protein
MIRRPSPENHLLALLPPDVRAHLSPHLKTVSVKPKHVIFRAHTSLDAAYFPDTCVISLLTRLKGGETPEVGLVGRDGMSSVSVFPGVNMMPCDGVVLIGGTAQRIEAAVLRQEVHRGGPLHDVLGRYAHLTLARSMQIAACNSVHSVKERCARWLLMTHDLIDGDEYPLTQDALAMMLGVRRPSVTVVARALQRAGAIDYRRGRVKVLDREGLESASCECYRLMREEERRLLGATPTGKDKSGSPTDNRS